MRWTRTLLPTLRETPADAEARSHVLMVRAGLIRKLAAGSYFYLPLGMRALSRVIGIVREEMEQIGALEVLVPALWPIDMLRESGRLNTLGKDILRFTDRHGREGFLAPTPDEAVGALARETIQSYRQLPVVLHQIQTQFSDEARPRLGVIRVRESFMEDAYSFDADQEGLEGTWQAIKGAYRCIFERCGVERVEVESQSAAVGGGRSETFVAPCDVGDDLYVHCAACGYCASPQKAEVAPPAHPAEPDGSPELKEVDTPGAATIDAVSELLGIGPERMIKTLIYKAEGRTVAALVRGDHEVSEAKLAALLGVGSIELADAGTIEAVTGAPVGFASPVGLTDIEVVADRAVMALREGVAGANRADAHLTGVVPGRDFQPGRVEDIRVARDGDQCGRCGSALELGRGIEVGHVHQLGTRYGDSVETTFLSAAGRQEPCAMGCYGISISRILAAAIEQHADDAGIVWGPEVAPYEALVMPLDMSEPEIAGAAESAHEALRAAGISTLLDDRDERPGAKFKDADLIGVPIRIVVGKGYLNSGRLEVQRRRDGIRWEVAADGLVAAVQDALESMMRDCRGDACAGG